MRKLLASIASLMLVLTLCSGFQSSAAYAAEIDGCSKTIVDENAPGHSAGDADEVPGDSDKATPHHHSVGHSHELAVPAAEVASLDLQARTLPSGQGAAVPPAAADLFRDLRPPIA
ncbi:MAG: hypothetical protein J0I47_13110 [Sphingomonas sp.]|uniref:hypothetical protein n=1 Tax=Sphingomonas sp. TaxID=28214 RepID=UPI001ACB3B16|nr:hypothetical protein [Sphingomonas sp.]MBN8809157.1 hypothetical protein [Sphingomonas sp.]